MSVKEIRAGLQKKEFVPYFQPIVALSTGEVAGLEVLGRWEHGTLGVVPPDAFIGIAEREDLISELTAVLMERSFQAAAALPTPQWLAFNFSPHLMHDLTLPKKVRDAANSAAFPLDRVVIEITESALLVKLQHAQIISAELKQLGCRLALDDFGTGYSSLLHLQSLPFDEIKVDRSFVSSMTERRQNRKIVSAVVGLGQSLGLTTVAEGVETDEQAEMLLLLGCEMGQGWLFGKPVPPERLSEAITKRRPIRLRPTSSLWLDISHSSPPGQRLSHLQALYGGAPVGLAFLSPDLRYISINRHLAQMNGAPIHDHLGRLVSEVIPAVYAQLEPYLRRALEGVPVNAVEITRAAIDRSHEEAFLLSYLPAFDEVGEIVGISVAVIDISDRRRTEDALRESEDHYRHMVELNPQIPWVLDAEGMATMISPRWQQITGMSEEESRGRGFLNALHPEDQGRVAESIAHSILSGDQIDVECRVRTANGRWRWFRSQGAPRRNKDGKIIRWYGSADDIQTQKQLEEELRMRARLDATRPG